MVLYTPAAIAANTTEDHMKARVHQAIWETNWAFIDSGVDVQIRPVHLARVEYQPALEALGLQDTLDILTKPSLSGGADDATLDCVHAQRDSVKADAVVLVVEKSSTKGGQSNGMYDPEVDVAIAAPKAFAVVTQLGLTYSGDYFFPHEIGHVMGSHHDSAPGVPGAYPYSHGHTQASSGSASCRGWQTIMGQASCSGCEWLRAWSNPLKTHCSRPTGTANEDNAKSLNNTRSIVTNFRCGLPQPHNVWMKDTWDDTGAEPDPAQAGAPMWLSPYIWVRNSRDAKFEHQHDHENPRASRTNWAYVKLHNGGAQTNGDLELYYARASTGLAWPSDWKPIGVKTISKFRANSTTIAEIEWKTPAGSGHYCLLARWNSTTDPMRIEGTDVSINTRENNNIVWRNLQIVGLARQTLSLADVAIDALAPRESTSIEILAPANFEGVSFLDFGRIDVGLNSALTSAARGREAGLSGLKRRSASSYSVDKGGALLSDLRLDAKTPARLALTFRRPPGTSFPRGVYRVDVIQTRDSDGKRSVVGGVSYEVRTDR